MPGAVQRLPVNNDVIENNRAELRENEEPPNQGGKVGAVGPEYVGANCLQSNQLVSFPGLPHFLLFGLH